MFILSRVKALALTADDVSSPECVQQAEVLVAEANQTLAHARSAVASAKQNRSGFLPPFNVSSSRKGKGKGRVKGKSKESSCLICGRSDHFWRQCPERQSKGSGKGGKKGSRTFYLGAAWGFDSELSEAVDVVLDCGATDTAGGVEAVQILVDAVTQGFVLSLASKWTLWTDHGFVLLMVTGAGLSEESGC